MLRYRGKPSSRVFGLFIGRWSCRTLPFHPRDSWISLAGGLNVGKGRRPSPG
jgi:hypothetical protein